ncbi:MAG TPA: hypothetical protein PLH91_05425 [Tenuifilaceae bacterium]|nr:hypothetical protein [Tenuifilaceae bacterium]HPI44650.1 hypothetical protein [Tenuifilaceae bacterium]HPN20978.1 hypothetical protein [Tenuifilaceae bacterium]
MNKLAYILELIWFGLAIFCLVVGIYAVVNSGINRYSSTFLLLSVFAFGFFYIRRRRRLNAEK